MKKGIVVAGSINIDMVFSLPRLPLQGETVSGGSFAAHPGGKGANQAVAAARLGAPTVFLGCVGEDSWGDFLLAGLQQAGVDCSYVTKVPGPSGCAVIYVAAGGKYDCSSYRGKCPHHARKSERAREVFSTARVLMTQLEIPVETVAAALELAKSAGLISILDPAPVKALTPEMLSLVDYITPNALEASELTGIDVHCWNTADQAARKLRSMGPETVIITMGKQGAFFSGPQGHVRILAPRVVAVDSTAAGDAFNAALAVALAQGTEPDIAADIAAAAGALAVSRAGAQPSLPTLEELAQVVKLPW